MSRYRAERALAWTLRAIGCLDLAALAAVAMPRAAMSVVHEWWGLGPLPEGPVVGYLARSTSFLYAFRGTVMIYASCDVAAHRGLVRLLAWTSLALGASLFGIDLHEGMPAAWTRSEWFLAAGTGLLLLSLLRLSRPARRVAKPVEERTPEAVA